MNQERRLGERKNDIPHCNGTPNWVSRAGTVGTAWMVTLEGRPLLHLGLKGRLLLNMGLEGYCLVSKLLTDTMSITGVVA
jgi:hypothetical protein